MRAVYIGLYLGLALWGFSLTLMPLDTMYATLFWIGEMIIWLGSTVILVIGSVVWLAICLLLMIGVSISLNDWWMNRRRDD